MEWNQEKNNNINFILHIYKEIATRVDQSAEQTQRKQNPSNTNQSGPKAEAKADEKEIWC